MNKTTIIALVAVVILAVVFVLVNVDVSKEDMESLSVPGIRLDDKKDVAKPAEGEEPKAPSKEELEEEEAKVGPADKIVMTREGKEYVLVKVDDKTWKLTSPFEAFAETYKVRGMLRAFDTALKSNYAREVSEAALEKLGLDENTRIRVAMYQGETRLVDLYLGRVDKKEMGMAADTMVMVPDAETPVYYRLPGKDLRTPFDIDLEELRDKKLFAVNKDDIVKFVLEDPRGDSPAKMVLVKKDSADDKADKKDQWELVEPGGIEVENVAGFASTFAGTRAEKFMEKLPGADSTALDKAYKITATVKEGGKEITKTLLLGAGRKKGVYARVEGRDGFVVVSKYAAKQLMKTLGEFRKKKLFSFKADDVEGIAIEHVGQPRLKLVKRGKDWTFVEPAGQFASASRIKSLTSGIANFRAAEFIDDKSEAEAGLAQPAVRVTATLSAALGSGTSTLLIGNEYKNKDDQERFYAKLEGQKQIFGVMKYSKENVGKSLDDLRDKRMFRLTNDQVVSVTITHPDQTLTFESEDKAGKTVWNMTAPKAKKDVSLASIVSTLTSLDVEEIVEGKKPEDVGLDRDTFTISLKLKDGTEQSVTISEEVDDNKNFAMTPSVPELAGKIVKISKFKVQNLAKKLPDFEKKPGPPGPPGGMPMGMPGGMPGGR